MARCGRASLLPLLLLACAVVHSSHCSRSPPPGEPQKPGAGVVLSYSPACCSPVVHGGADDEPRGGGRKTGQVRLTEKEATGHRGASADGDVATLAVLDEDDGAGSEQRRKSGAGAPLRRMMLSSKLARGRVLGGKAEDSAAAGASCHSNNAHITCAPPAQ